MRIIRLTFIIQIRLYTRLRHILFILNMTAESLKDYSLYYTVTRSGRGTKQSAKEGPKQY